MSTKSVDPRAVMSLALESLHARRDFTELRPGVEIAPVYQDDGNGASAAILRYAPGAAVPEHEHPGYEHVLILEGEQSDHRGVYGAGTFVVNPPGSCHAVFSEKGCVALLIWQRPVRFL